MADTYQLGVTLIHVGNALAQNQEIAPGRGWNGWQFKIHAGSGTLCVVNSLGASHTAGYPVGASEVINATGPARFFLAASGATVTIALVASLSAGFSLNP